jgi:hypothetical protein
MADVFISHLEWTGAAKGPTRDPARFSRDLNLTVDAITLPMSSAPSYRGDPSPTFAFAEAPAATFTVLARIFPTRSHGRPLVL